MPKAAELTGRRINKLTVIARRGSMPSSGASRWECLCDCGSTCFYAAADLTRGQVRSCGCWDREAMAARRTTHGATIGRRRSAEFKAWSDMRRRCRDPRRADFIHYGGRGITVHAPWDASFAAFLADVGPKPEPSYVIDRIDPNGDYAPGNVRWTPREVMNDNKRSTVLVTYKGETKGLAVWVRELGLKYDRAHERITNGWTPEAAFEQPPTRRVS